VKITSKFIILFYTVFIFLVYEPFVFAKRVFVLHHETGRVTEYNPVDLRTENQIKIFEYNGYQRHEGPAYQFRSPTKDILVNQSGNILYYEDRITHQKISGKKLNVRKLCYWNGEKWHHAEVSYPEGIYLISAPFLDEKQAVFYWYVNSGVENLIFSNSTHPTLYINNNFELYRFYFQDGLVQERIIKLVFDECLCSTGVCEETCPIGRMTIFNNIIQQIISVEHFVSGQLGSEIVGTTYYKKYGNNWIEKNKAEIQNQLFLSVVEDAGCCGWENESSDQLRVRNGKQKFIIYDEFTRFKNRNYDISFYISNAELSLDKKRVAYTTKPCCKPFDKIRFSSHVFDKSRGKEYVNSEDQKKMQPVLDTLPLVEVSTIHESPRILATVKNAVLSGWMDNDRVLLIKDNKLAIFSLSSRDIQTFSIPVESPDQVYLR
jgi:hypothetical protein